MTESISRDPTFEDIITILTGRSMQDNTVARLQSTRVVLRESFTEESQNIPCSTLKRRGSRVIMVADPDPDSIGSVNSDPDSESGSESRRGKSYPQK